MALIRLHRWLFLPVLLLLSIRSAHGQAVCEPPAELSVPGNHKSTVRRAPTMSLHVQESRVREVKLGRVLAAGRSKISNSGAYR